jgi:hypothetical protein
MRIRTLALALALSCGASTMVQAAGQKKVSYKPAKTKQVKMQKTRRYKQSKASKVKPRKAPKRK